MKKLNEFENKWSELFEVKHSLFVNSGPSANLLMLYSLIDEGILKKSDMVIVPASSTVDELFPVINLGLEPLLCDCNLKDLSVDLEFLEFIMEKNSPKVLLLNNVLGLVPDMDAIVYLCQKYNVILLESMGTNIGSKYKNQMLGSFGVISSFSLNTFSKNGGGFLCTDNSDLFNSLKKYRTYGFDFSPSNDQIKLGLSKFDSIVNQFDKLSKNFWFYEMKTENNEWRIEHDFEGPPNKVFVSNGGYPILSLKKENIIKELKKKKIKVKPILDLPLGEHPFYIKHTFQETNLPNISKVCNDGFCLENNQKVGENYIKSTTNIVNKELGKDA